jgi:signal transduction histidine kinase
MTAWPGSIFPRSTAFRLAVAMAGLCLVSIACASVAAYWLIAQDLDARIRAQIAADASAFAAIEHSEGGPELATELKALGQIRNEERLVVFAPGGGAPQAGNATFPEVFTGWRHIPSETLHSTDGRLLYEEFLAYGMPLAGGTLIVARNADAVDEVQDIFIGAALWGLGIAVVLVVAGAAAFARRAEARIAGIAATLDAASAGDLERRVPQEAAASQDDLGRVAESINAMLDRLSRSVASLKQVSADIAHDLKTPIQRLRSTLEAVRGAPAEEVEDGIDEAIEQTDQIVQTFQALLRIAQIEGGSPRSRFRPTDLVELCGAVAEVFQPAIEESGHRFAVDIVRRRPLMVHGDRDLLAQMLSNLLGNAIRHAPDPAEITLAAAPDDGSAVLTVADTGPGIPAGERERVFRRLYRLERSRTTEGSGLGLSMAAAVVELHGGTIRLEDNAPGLRAVVRLPLLAEPRRE